MNLTELKRTLGQLRLGGMAATLETRLRHAQAEPMAPIDLLSLLIADEMTKRQDRLLERRIKQAGFRDARKTLDNFDFTFNPKMNRSLVLDLATAGFIGKREDALFLGPGGTDKSHLAQAIGWAAIQQGYAVIYHETHMLLDELAEAVIDGSRRSYVERIATVGCWATPQLWARCWTGCCMTAMCSSAGRAATEPRPCSPSALMAGFEVTLEASVPYFDPNYCNWNNDCDDGVHSKFFRVELGVRTIENRRQRTTHKQTSASLWFERPSVRWSALDGRILKFLRLFSRNLWINFTLVRISFLTK